MKKYIIAVLALTPIVYVWSLGPAYACGDPAGGGGGSSCSVSVPTQSVPTDPIPLDVFLATQNGTPIPVHTGSISSGSTSTGSVAPVRKKIIRKKKVVDTSKFSCSTIPRTCKSVKSKEEAQFYLNTCGVKRFDRDHDGIACEK